MIRPRESGLPEFLAHWLNSPSSCKFAPRNSRQGHVRRIFNLKAHRSIDSTSPPLAEQRRIVAELDALQAEVDALKRMQAETAAELDALLPAILDRAFKGEL